MLAYKTMDPTVRYYTTPSSTGSTVPVYNAYTRTSSAMSHNSPSRHPVQRKGSQREESRYLTTTTNGHIGNKSSRSQEDIRYITAGSTSPRKSPNPTPSLAQRRIAHHMKLMAEDEQSLNSTDDEIDFTSSRNWARGRSDSKTESNYHPACLGVDTTSPTQSGRYRILTDPSQRPTLRTDHRRASHSDVNLHRPTSTHHRSPSPHARTTTQLQQLHFGGTSVRDFNQNYQNSHSASVSPTHQHRKSTAEAHRQLPTPPSPNDRRFIVAKIGGTGQYDNVVSSGGNRRDNCYYEYNGY